MIKYRKYQRPEGLLFYRAATLFFILISIVLYLLWRNEINNSDRNKNSDSKGQQIKDNSGRSDQSAHEGHGIIVTDLALEAARIEQEESYSSDVSMPYYTSPSATVHMHVIGYEQTCPLHIHRKTEEISVIVSGIADVTQIHYQNGSIVSKRDSFKPGMVIYTPPFCGHKWINKEKRTMQANLVFSVPPFDGNFYIQDDDYRLEKGGQSQTWNPDEQLNSFALEEVPFLLKKLPAMDKKMSFLLVREEASLDAHPGAIIIYINRGSGWLFSSGKRSVKEQQLIIIPPYKSVKVKAEPDDPLNMLIFTPES